MQNRVDQISCTGKLPFSQGWIRRHIGNQNLKLVEYWLQEGFIHSSRDGLIRNQVPKPLGLNHGLLLNYGLGRKAILGYLGDSEDSEGRYSPFLLFQELLDPIISAVQHFVPIIYQSRYQHFQQIVQQTSSSDQEEQFFQRLNEGGKILPVTMDEMTDYMTQLFSSIDYAALWKPALTETESSMMLPLLTQISREINSQGTWLIKLPLASVEGGFLSLSFWLSLMKVLRTFHYRNLHLAWTMVPQNNQMNLSIYHGSLSIAFFRSLLQQESSQINQIDLRDYFSSTRLELQPIKQDLSLQAVIDSVASR